MSGFRSHHQNIEGPKGARRTRRAMVCVFVVCVLCVWKSNRNPTFARRMCAARPTKGTQTGHRFRRQRLHAGGRVFGRVVAHA